MIISDSRLNMAKACVYLCQRLLPQSVTLNDLERRNIDLILRYFTEFGSFRGALRKSG